MVFKGNRTASSRSRSAMVPRSYLRKGDEHRSDIVLGSKEHLREFSTRLMNAHEEERRRVAHEVHENLSQAFVAIQLRVETALGEMGESGSTRLREILEPVTSILQDGIEGVRRIAERLSPLILDDLGLLAAVSRLCREVVASHPTISIEKRLEIEEREIPAPLKVVIYRVLESSLCRILKQRSSGLVEIGLGRSGDRISLTFRVHGGVLGSQFLSGGEINGLSDSVTIGERVMLSGGTLTVVMDDEGGVTLKVEWPLQDFSRTLSRAQVREPK